MGKKKIVFTYVEAGLGHIIPIETIADAFEKKYGNEVEVIRSFIFRDSKRKNVVKMGNVCLESAKQCANNKCYSFFEGISYHFSSKFILRLLDFHFRKGVKEFMQDMQELAPDMMISSYYLPSHLAKKSNELGLTSAVIATYSPDPYIYPAWDRKCDLFLVNNGLAYESSIKKGFDKEIVKQIPFVLKSKVVETITNVSQQQAREKLNLENKFTLLLSSGAYGKKSTEKLIKKITKLNLDMNVVVVCGKNEKMLQRLQTFNKNFAGKTNLYVIGFTEKLDEYMKASNLLVGKGGSNTIIESICLSLPMIVNAEVNALEKKTSAYWEKKGVLIREKKTSKIIKLIIESFNNKEFLNKYLENIKKYGKFDGAEKCADLLYETLIANNGKVEKWKYSKNLKNVG